MRPTADELANNAARSRLRFAGRAILDSVHEKNRKWTWAYFAKRRDDRRKYVDLFKKRSLNPGMNGPVSLLHKTCIPRDLTVSTGFRRFGSVGKAAFL